MDLASGIDSNSTEKKNPFEHPKSAIVAVGGRESERITSIILRNLARWITLDSRMPL